MNQSAHVDSFARDNLPPAELWPEMLFDLPCLKYPARLNCAVELLERTVETQPEKMALVGESEAWTYAELLHKVNQIAAVLQQEMKLVPGNRVLLRSSNQPMLAAAILAVWKAGCIAVPTMPLLRAKELAVIIDKAQVGAAICLEALKDDLELAREQAPVLKQVLYFGSSGATSLEQLMQSRSGIFNAIDTSAEDVCLIAFTSGTTGKPKGTMHFHRDILAICDCFPKSILHSQSHDIFIGTPPLAFTFGLGGLLLFPLRVGATAVLLEKPTPDILLKGIEQHRATICFTAPTFYRQMVPLTQGYDLRSLKKTVSAGEALPTATRESWQRATDINMIDGIGATEMLHIFISASGNDIRAGATGKPVPGYQASILDDNGKPVEPGVVGRLAVKGPTGCRYLADPRQENYVFEGWNLTGDAYEMDADGYFWYRARVDDMIISSGYNIAGPEVEDILLKHEAVTECAVIGVPDDERGQIVKGFVVLKPGYSPGLELTRELQNFVKQHIAPYKYPRAIEYRTSLPRTETGKLQRFKLREGL